jgi:hypothetical protein
MGTGGVLCSEVKLAECEADHSLNVEVKHERDYTFILRIRLHGMERDNFTFLHNLMVIIC